MGLFDLFRARKLPPGDPVTQKAGLKLINKNADLDTRVHAAQTLAEIGTEEAIYCLLQRFTVTIGGGIPDEDEKTFAYDQILKFGRKSIPPVVRFLKDKEYAAKPLLLLESLTTSEEFVDILLDVIATFDVFYSKFPDKKIQVFKKIGEFNDIRILDAITPFLEDDDDDVRIAVVSAIAAQDNEEATRETLLEMIIQSAERPRVRLAACEALATKEWKVKGFRKRVADALPDRYYLDAKGHILRRSGTEILLDNP